MKVLSFWKQKHYNFCVISHHRSGFILSRSQWVELLGLGFTYLSLWGLGVWWVRRVADGQSWIGWAIASLVFLGYAFYDLVNHLDLNVPASGGLPFPDLGWANRITLIRAGLLGGVLGLIFLFPLKESTGWLAGVLYALVAILDFVDGWLARITRRTSQLGERLDMHWDSLGVLTVSVLLVRMGQVPLPFILVGLARFLYVFAIQRRERRHLPLAPLPHNPYRRFMAGIQMGLMAVLLFPVFSPPVTSVVAWLWMIPFLTAFLRDGLYVTTILDATTDPLLRWGIVKFLAHFVSPLSRLLTLLSGLVLMVFPPVNFPLGEKFILAGLWVLVALGIVGRVAGIGWMVMAGLVLLSFPHHAGAWGALVGGFGLLMLGTGKLSLWTPEEWLIYHRAGESLQRLPGLVDR